MGFDPNMVDLGSGGAALGFTNPQFMVNPDGTQTVLFDESFYEAMAKVFAEDSPTR